MIPWMNAACIILLCRVASIIFGLLAAWYWYKASTKKITDKDNNPHNPGIELVGNADNKGRLPLYTSTAMEQSRLNAIAAKYTAVTVGFQIIQIATEILR
jgi:hypothetical protein